MKTNKFTTQKLFLSMLFLIATNSFAQISSNAAGGPTEPEADGLSCETAYQVNTEQVENYNFLEEQEDYYFSFSATNDTMNFTIKEENGQPLARILEVEIYLKEDCDNLNLIYSKTAPNDSSYIGYVQMNFLSNNENYLLKITRDYNYTIDETQVIMLVEDIYYPCPANYNLQCDELIKNGGFNYIDTTTPVSDYFKDGRVCNWLYSESPDVVGFNYNRVYVGMWANLGNVYESIKQLVNLNAGKYYVSLEIAGNAFPAPDNFYVRLKSSVTNKDTIIFPIPQDSIKQVSHSSPLNFTKVSKYFEIDETFDTLILHPRMTTWYGGLHSVAFVDNISIRPFTDTIDAGPDITVENCTEIGDTIGPDCLFENAQYSWTPTWGLSNPNIPNPIANPAITTTYTLNVSPPSQTWVQTGQVTVHVNDPVDYLLPDSTNISQLRTIAGLSSNQTTLSDKILKVEGTLFIEEDFRFNDCSFYMGEDAKIVTQNNSSLIFDNLINDTDVEFFKPCSPDIYWDGIYQTGGDNFQFGDNNALDSDSSYWEFNNSKNGINITNVNNVIISEVRFENNGRAIKVENTGTNQTNASINSLIIRCTEPLSYNGVPFYPNHALEIINVNTNQYFQIGAGAIQDSSSFNLYGSGGNMYIENSDGIWIEDVGFYGFNNQYYFPGQPTNSTLALEVKGDSRNPELDVSSCFFLGCLGGINVNGNASLFVRNNKVNINKSGVIQSGIENSYFMHGSNVRNLNSTQNNYLNKIENNSIYNVEKGIHLYNSPYFHIYDNTFDMEVQPDSNSYTDNYNEESVAIYSNAYDIDFGFVVIPEPIDTIPIVNINEIFVVENNTISHSKVGIQAEFIKAHILSNTIIDQNNRFTPPQFGTAPPSYGIRLLNQTGVIEGNKVENNLNKYSGTMPNTQEKVIGVSIENSMEFDGFYTEIYCNTTENTGLGFRFGGYNGQPNIFNNRMVSNKIGFALDNEAYIGDVGSFEFAVGPTEVDASNEWVGTFGNSETFNFSNDDPNNPPKYYYKGTGPQIGQQDAAQGYFPIKDTLTLNDNTISCTAPQLVDHSSGKKQAATSYNKSGRKAHWRLRGNSSDSAFYLRQQLQFYHLSKDSVLYNDPKWSTFKDSMKNTALGRAMGKNSRAISMSNSTNFDQNVSTVEPLLNKHFADSSLSSSELDQLRQIAVLCPFTDGIAVYQARRVLHEYGERLYVNTCETSQLPNNQRFIRIKAEEKVPFALYPNPANEQLNIRFSVEKDENVQLEFYDVLGKQVGVHSLKNGNLHKVNISHLQQGVYIYRLFKAQTQLHSGKVVIE